MRGATQGAAARTLSSRLLSLGGGGSVGSGGNNPSLSDIPLSPAAPRPACARCCCCCCYSQRVCPRALLFLACVRCSRAFTRGLGSPLGVEVLGFFAEGVPREGVLRGVSMWNGDVCLWSFVYSMRLKRSWVCGLLYQFH